jgi:RNA polymerase sigma factor (sigma-70 family)
VTDADEALIARIVGEGSEAAFRELFRRHTPRLLQFVMRIMGTATDAEDVVQETWLRAAPALSNFRGDSSFGTWLCGIGLNTSLEQLRRRSRRDGEFSIGDTDLPSRALSTDERIDLEWAIGKLSPGCRTVLVLHDVEGFTHDEIAGHLGIAEGTSKAQLFKARRAMRALLTRQETKADVQR